jgi:hypothetical protein
VRERGVQSLLRIIIYKRGCSAGAARALFAHLRWMRVAALTLRGRCADVS